VSCPLLLDEMFSDTIAEQLRAKGHDVIAVVTGPALVSLPDDQILAHAAATGRALVTANLKDFMPLDGQYRAADQRHAGLILVSAKTFPQDRSYASAVTAHSPLSLTSTGRSRPIRSSSSPGTDVRSALQRNPAKPCLLVPRSSPPVGQEPLETPRQSRRYPSCMSWQCHHTP
jgi:Domain of unknown function (DUF5615)